MFPLSDYERVCRRLSSTLNGVLNQWLLPKQKGGRVLAAEIFTNSDATRWLLKDGLIHQIPAYLERGTDELCSLKLYRECLVRNGLF
ncbi:MAG: hypothetical protein HQL08_16410 [Nitrospirae bacterium]|nr:hypothetical protein [Nitrospirota bacterium]